MRITTSAAAIVALSATAFALNASAAPVDEWDGFYLGVTAGYMDAQTRTEDALYDWNGGSFDWNFNGGYLGAQAGYNSQDDNVVDGIEIDFGLTNVESNEIYANDNRYPNSINWTGSLRGRSGIAMSGVYLYQTLGVSVADFNRSWTEFDDFNDSWPNLGDTKGGVIGGFGLEGDMGGGWSLRGEFLATRYADNSSTNPNGYILNIDDTTYALRAGLNYRFGDRPVNDGMGFVEGTPYDFSGYYVGVSGGGHQATVQTTDIDYDWHGGTHDALSDGAAASVQAGWNNQMNAFVYGVEANATVFSGDDTYNDDQGGDFRNTDTALNWALDLRLITGMAVDNTRMYIFSGYSYGDYDAQTDRYEDGSYIGTADLSGGQSGFVVGTGMERALTPNISASIEGAYRAYDGDTAAYDGNRYRGAAQDISIMAGVAYHLGDRGHSMGSGALAPADWSGWFAGVDGIFAYHHGDETDIDYEDYGATHTLPSFGVGVGVNAGYNWQNGAFVYGLVADGSIYSNDESENSPNYRSWDSSLNWMSTVRARGGVASGDAFMYATAGIAFADVDAKTHLEGGDYLSTYDADDMRVGWTAGLGVERRINEHSSLRFETLYTRFGEQSEANPQGNECSNGWRTRTCVRNFQDSNITARAGYVYRF